MSLFHTNNSTRNPSAIKNVNASSLPSDVAYSQSNEESSPLKETHNSEDQNRLPTSMSYDNDKVYGIGNTEMGTQSPLVTDAMKMSPRTSEHGLMEMEGEDPLEQLLRKSQINDDPWLYTRMTAGHLSYWRIMTTRRPMFAFINRMLAFHCIQFTTSIYPQHM